MQCFDDGMCDVAQCFLRLINFPPSTSYFPDPFLTLLRYPEGEGEGPHCIIAGITPAGPGKPKCN